MVSSEQAQMIALFFLLSLMDEKVALQAAHKSIAQLKAGGGTQSPSEVCRVLRRSFDSHRKMLSRNRPTEISETAMTFPDGVDFNTWQKFHRASSDGEITAILVTRVLGYSEAEAAEGFAVSTGTMHYRVAKGTRALGAILSRSGSSM